MLRLSGRVSVVGVMGAAIDCERFEQVDYERFSERLDRSLDALARLLARPGFGVGPATLGVEVELLLVGEHGRPLPCNQAVHRAVGDPQVGLELDRFNVEVLHQGTVRDWNRAVYDPTAGGYLHVEMRALAAGPTLVDALANAAFLVGLALALSAAADERVGTVPFEGVRRGFYRAARDGLAARLPWPGEPGGAVRTLPAADLALRLLPLARLGLVGAGVAAEETDRLLAVVRARVATGQTRAAWQRRGLLARRSRHDERRAPEALLARYLDLAATGRPVHAWPPVDPAGATVVRVRGGGGWPPFRRSA
jgi:gamma-glutamyl:cysteine ligase YbdK (ATP-grasp superfamily)